jgi:hypothetical protein
VYTGWARVVQGAHAEGLEEIRGGLEIWRMGGAQLLLPWLLVQYGDACLRADRIEDAIEALNEGRRLAAANGDGWCEPELLRLLGMAELAAGHPREAAVERIRAAADLAAERRHPGLELRAAITLAELDADDGRLAPLAAMISGGADAVTAQALVHQKTTG